MSSICAICEKKLGKTYMKPSKCAQKHGFSKCHRICQKCWFDIFAKENANHKCPGCAKKMKLPRIEKKKAVEVVVVNLLD
jgi:hypothetical protein